MRPDPEDHTDLIHFLKRYQPAPPPSSQQLEDRVMALVRQTPRTPSSLRFWVIPTAIAASVGLWWGTQPKSFTPSFSQQPNEEVLAAYLVNDWQAVTQENMAEDSTENSTHHWRLLISPEPQK
ncbi:MAG: hypothetical protein ACRC6M_12185 [Microcystaceae cyanobacterium]